MCRPLLFVRSSQINPQMPEPEGRNVERPLEGMLKVGYAAAFPTAREKKVWQITLMRFFVDFLQDLRGLHALPVAHHRCACKPLRISMLRVFKSLNAVIGIVKIKNPLRARRIPKPLAFDNELLATPLRIKLIAVQENPLEIWPFVLAFRASLIIGIRLIIALLHGSKVAFWKQFAARRKQTKIQATVQLNFWLRMPLRIAQKNQRAFKNRKTLPLTLNPQTKGQKRWAGVGHPFPSTALFSRFIKYVIADSASSRAALRVQKRFSLRLIKRISRSLTYRKKVSMYMQEVIVGSRDDCSKLAKALFQACASPSSAFARGALL